jgi:hypothetical protein
LQSLLLGAEVVFEMLDNIAALKRLLVRFLQPACQQGLFLRAEK